MRRILVMALLCIASLASSPVRADWVPTVPHGLRVERIGSVDGARELAFAPNGDLFVGTRGENIYVVPHAESSAGGSRVFVHLADAPDAGVSFANGALYVGTQHAVWKIAYRTGQLKRIRRCTETRFRANGIASGRQRRRRAYHDLRRRFWDACLRERRLVVQRLR